MTVGRKGASAVYYIGWKWVKEVSNWNGSQNLTYHIHDTEWLKLITRWRLGLSYLGDHKFRKNFLQDCVCLCVLAVRTLKQQPISFFTAQGIMVHGNKSLFQKIFQISGNISEQKDSTITKILFFGDNKLDFKTNKILLMSTIVFIWPTGISAVS